MVNTTRNSHMQLQVFIFNLIHNDQLNNIDILLVEL